MPDDTNRSATAFQEIIRVLEDAVQAGVHSIGLEYEGRDLMVFYNVGSMGLGASRIPQELRQDVIAELVKRARPFRQSRGKMRVSLQGKDYEVLVERYESFGEWNYNLTLKERKARR